MPAARDDYILRLIQQAAAALRNLRTRLGGGASADEVSRDADEAIGTLLGPQRPTLERLDAWSAANLLGDADRVFLWSDLVALQADLREASGDAEGSAALRKRASSLKSHAPR
jgi:hypothetical protein